MKKGIKAMGDSLSVEKIRIDEMYDKYISAELSINRRYQRKLVWSLREKQDFIDTLMKKYPIPLILFASYQYADGSGQYTEIIDGLQRLEAIFAFISGKFEITYKGCKGYFNLDAIPGYGSKVRAREMCQRLPMLPLDLCRTFLNYNLPCSTSRLDDVDIDEIFRRINSKGRQLSSQDLRQVGVTGRFADLVRKTASYVRGDYSESDIITIDNIDRYSLNNKGLNYGVDVYETFWVKQGIINEEQLRRSKDEEIIAHLYVYLITDGKHSPSSATLDNAYKEGSTLKPELDNRIDSEREMLEQMEFFSKAISVLYNSFSCKKFNDVLFSKQKVYNKDYAFIVLFLAVAELLLDNMYLTDTQSFLKKLNNLGDNELSELTSQAVSRWNKEVRDRMVSRVKNVIKPCFAYNQRTAAYEEWEVRMVNLIERAEAEEQMYDFKAGVTDLRTGAFNVNCVSKIVKTLAAMANTRPNEEGVVVVGIPDDQKNASSMARKLNTSTVKCKNHEILGIKGEATKYYGSVDKYLRKIKATIEKEPIKDSFRNEILTEFRLVEYKDKLLLIFTCKSDTPVFYDKRIFVRHGSHTEEVEIGSDEFDLIQRKFYSNNSGIRECTAVVGRAAKCNAF